MKKMKFTDVSSGRSRAGLASPRAVAERPEAPHQAATAAQELFWPATSLNSRTSGSFMAPVM